ncbi:hypothetical protein CHUAL_004777 [Chamberlinius hualienensis]
MISKLIVFCGLVALALCGAPNLPGDCPEIKGVENADFEKVSGEWVEHFHGIIGDAETKDLNNIEKCETKTVTRKPTGVELKTSFIDGNGKQQSKIYTATKIDGPQAKFTITNDDLTAKKLTATSFVVDTDYTNRLVSVICYTDGKNHKIMVGVHGRGKSFAAADADKAREALKANNLNIELTAVDQTC